MTYTPWTEDEDRDIRQNYRRLGIIKTMGIVNKHGNKRSKTAISQRASRLGVSTPWKTFNSGYRY